MEHFKYLPEKVRSKAVEFGQNITGIRLRRCKPIQYELLNEDVLGDIFPHEQFEDVLLKIMGHSLYARQNELDKGYISLPDGSRAGVCGRFSEHGPRSVQDISSVYIRIAHEIKGCALKISEAIESSKGIIIISPPGAGKTTLLRDSARLLSYGGNNVCIIDERGEIAACEGNFSSMDVGPRTDVITGYEKHRAILMAIRSCAPDVIVTDEIGDEHDIIALNDAVRCGVRIMASAHGDSLDISSLRNGVRMLLEEGTFDTGILLGPGIGEIREIRKYENSGRRSYG